MLNKKEEELLRRLRRSEQRLIAAYKLVDLGTWDWDLLTNEQNWSEKTYQILGIESGCAVSRELFESLLHPEDRDYVNDNLKKFLRQKEDLTYEFRVLQPSGEVRYICSHLTFEHDEFGRKVRVLGTNQDVTEQKMVENSLRESEERLKVAQSLVRLGCWDWDLITNKQIWSNETYNIFGLNSSLEANRELFESLIHPDDIQLVRSITKNGIRTGKDFSYEFRIIDVDGKTRYISAHVGVKSDIHGNSIHLLGTNQDITKQKELELRIMHEANHDPLTQLPNRMKLNQELERLTREGLGGIKPFSLMWVDLDHFKQINDSYGHLIGDAVLLDVAKRLRDNVKGQGLVSRSGGDEFIIVLHNIDDAKKLEAFAQDVLNEFLKPAFFDGQPIKVQVSIGGAIYPFHGSNVRCLFKAADTALYKVKSKGRNGFVLAN